MKYEINLTAAQDMALGYASVSQDDWIQNVVFDRCRAATDEIVNIVVAKCLETNIQIPGSKDDMVLLAFVQGWVKSAAVRQTELEAEMAARYVALQAAEQAAQE